MCEESVFTHQAQCAFTEVTEMLFTDDIFHIPLKTVHIKDNTEALVLILNQIMRVFYVFVTFLDGVSSTTWVFTGWTGSLTVWPLNIIIHLNQSHTQ